MWLIVHQITKTIVCPSNIFFVSCFKKIDTKEGEFIITKEKTRILSFHNHALGGFASRMMMNAINRNIQNSIVKGWSAIILIRGYNHQLGDSFL